ncbi:uncharacterized protein LOC129728666 [Wyeomyia smithii]|uniref:uncharacterized protein LOC129728666 n=1 Tax=Wyeomyia smithii TaxID=174621 RepID=UPI002467F773|nr:uncharacterized protein LOC129728666 [Wyeomyia smithii]
MSSMNSFEENNILFEFCERQLDLLEEDLQRLLNTPRLFTKREVAAYTRVLETLYMLGAVAASEHAETRDTEILTPFTATSRRSVSDNAISVLYQNVRGLRTKVDEFFVAVSDAQYDVIVLTDTWLNECFHSVQLFGDAYNVYRCDRNPHSTNKKRGGGVLIAVTNRLNSQISPVRISDIVEQLWVKIVGLYRTISLGVVYISSDCASNVISIDAHIESALRQSNSLQPNDMHVVFGDYNQPNLSWISCSNGYAFPDPNTSAFSGASSALVDGFALLGIRQMSTIVNNRNHTLDPVFVNDVAKDACTLSEAHEPIIEADLFHPPLLLTLCISLPTSYESCSVSNEFNFGHADFVGVNQSLLETDWSVLDDFGNVDLAADFFSDTLRQFFRHHVPTFGPRMNPPWSNARLRFLKRKRSAALKKYTYRRNPTTKQHFFQISNEYRAYNQFRYSEYVRRTQNDLKKKPKRFWSFVNEKRKQSGLPSNMFLEDLVSANTQTTCDLFAKHFASVFSPTVASDLQIDDAMRNIP